MAKLDEDVFNVFKELLWSADDYGDPELRMSEDKNWITAGKTSISRQGMVERKGQILLTFDPSVWWKIELIYKTLTNDKNIRVLYGDK